MGFSLRFYLFIFLVFGYVITIPEIKANNHIKSVIAFPAENVTNKIFKYNPSSFYFKDTVVALLQVQGLVMLDGKPTKAEIEVNSIVKDGKFKTTITSNKVTGSFLLNLPVNDQYELVLRIDKFPQQVIELSTLGIDSFFVINVYADFTSAEYDKKLSELNFSVAKKNKNSFYKFDRQQFSNEYGLKKVDGLTYKVQIAAYKLYENFNYNNMIGLPKIIRQTDKDYITRFSMGNYETYKEAEVLLEFLKKNNLKDAFIYCVYKGEKKFLNELVGQNILTN